MFYRRYNFFIYAQLGNGYASICGSLADRRMFETFMVSGPDFIVLLNGEQSFMLTVAKIVA